LHEREGTHFGIKVLKHLKKRAKEFEKGRKWTYVQRLRSITQQRLRELIRLNKARRDYMKRLQMMIEEYNAGRMDVDQFFAALVQPAEDLNEEEQHHVAVRVSSGESDTCFIA